MADCACQPSDESLFVVYNQGVTYFPAPDPGLSASQLDQRARQQLETVITARDPSLLPAAQAVYNESLLRTRIPHPSLRAGLAMLVGTFAESLIEVYRAPYMRGAVFHTPSVPSAYAEAVYYLADGTREVWFNPAYQHELPGQFATSFAHEALHASGPILGENGRPEEATLHLVDTLVHAVMVRDQPELAQVRTLVSVDFVNDVLGIVFNSQSMLSARGPELFPGAGLPEIDSYYEHAPYLRDVPDVASTGDARLAEMITALGLPDVAVDPTLDVSGDGFPDYTRALLERLRLDPILDAGQVLDGQGLRQVAGTLTVGLATPGADRPPADFDGDGNTDVAVFRPSSGYWFVNGGAVTQYGTSGDIPVPGDYDGDGDTDVAVFRPSSGYWFVNGGPITQYGTSGDIPVPGDYDGDGDTDVAVFRPTTGYWFVNGGPISQYGTSGDIPVPGDYDGDGDTDVAVFRPTTGYWFVNGGAITQWGGSADIPLPLPAAIFRSFFTPL